MDYNTQENNTNKTVNTIITVLKMIVGIPTMLIAALVAVVGAVETMKQFFAFAEAGVYPIAAIMFESCMVGILLCLTVGAARFAFRKLNEKIPSGLFLALGVTFFVGAMVFSFMDEMEKDSWIRMDYPPYIETWETQVLYKTVDCNYNSRVYFSGYFDFLTRGFRENENIEIVYDESLTNRYRVEIKYKGLKSEMNIYTDTYSDYPKENIYIHPIRYDYETSVEDYAYMYKHKVDFEYSDKVAVEKITIRTAYPDMVDVSDINY